MKAFLERLGARLGTAWWHVSDTIGMLWVCRAAVLPVLVGGALIAFTDQARDIVVALSPTNLDAQAAILVAVLIWSTVAWYWARVTVQYKRANPVPVLPPSPPPSSPTPPPRILWHRTLTSVVPRWIGAAGILSVAVAFSLAGWAHHEAGDTRGALPFAAAALFYVVLARVFYVLVRDREPIARRLVKAGKVSKAWIPVRDPSDAIFDKSHPFALRFLVVSLLATPLFYGLVLAFPVAMGQHVLRGAVPATLLGFALIVPVSCTLVMLSARLRFPLFGTALAILVVFPYVFGDFHDVRTLRAAAATKSGAPPSCDAQDRAWQQAEADQRPLLRDAYLKWWDHNSKLSPPIPNDRPVPPLVMVAAAGGASRAAFWTSQVLAQIAAREPNFSDRLFMISGVSGGSLGAVTFRSIVEANRKTKGSPALIDDAPRQARQIIESDFLGPTFAAGVYVDLPSNGFSFLPRALLPGDRAVALEKAWEAAWNASDARKAAGFSWSDGFVATFGGARPWPVLVLNGTSVEKGKRIVTSNVRLDDNNPRDSAAADSLGLSSPINRYDTFAMTKADIPISTSVSMSARFPVISPTGALRDCEDKVKARVTDGGLFENFGAATLDEVLRFLTLRVDEVSKGQHQAAPIAILISSDPSLDQLHLRFDPKAPKAQPDCRPDPVVHAGNGQPECPARVSTSAKLLVDPVIALYDGRTARGEAAATAVLDRITDLKEALPQRLARTAPDGGADLGALNRYFGYPDNTDFFHFRQCRVPGKVAPTMSWHDSKPAWDVLTDMLGLTADRGDPCGNQAEFVRLCRRLATLGDGKAEATAMQECAARWKPQPGK
ncbi:MAG: hypothetical protein LCH95_06210 [Proteobacteria bacterium]|nr:hypothetical protein [Pseudomonadota bacterium]